MMERTLILVVTHRGLSDETAAALSALNCPSRLEIKGLANLAKARSIAFDKALEGIQGTPIDTVLCVDDDMVFPPEAARRLVDLSRASGQPTSGIALSREGVLAARPVQSVASVVGLRQRWLTGLAFMAAPRARLESCAERLRVVGGIREWCQTGEHPDFPGDWIGEDLWWCLHFGGVELAPIGVGHLKQIPIWPDDATIARVLSYGPGSSSGTG